MTSIVSLLVFIFNVNSRTRKKEKKTAISQNDSLFKGSFFPLVYSLEEANARVNQRTCIRNWRDLS